MKSVFKKQKGISKGAPSGFLISLVFHGVAFFLAGLFVVFTVVKKEEKKFIPPQVVERPKMKLKKPKVKVKKTTKPKPTKRIVTNVKRASMPDIQLPEMSGMGEGLAGGIGGFEIMPDFTDVTIFGSGQSIGNDFVGTFYDTKRFRGGGNNHGISREETIQAIVNFMKRGWNPSAFNRYYRSPRNLYTTCFAFPQVPAAVGPESFGEDVAGYGWLVHYKGQLVYPEDIRFRFWGQGDNLLAVRVDGEIVLLAPWPGWPHLGGAQLIVPWFTSLWSSPDPSNNRRYPMGNNYAVVGDWIELKAGEPLDMDVLVSEMSGGITCFILCVEVEGVEYPRNPFGGGPTLPVFKTEELSLDLKEQIWENLHEGDASLVSGPVFRDYTSAGISLPKVEEIEPLPAEPVMEEGFRLWTLRNGKSFEAEYVALMGGQVTLKSLRGKNSKVPLKDFSQEDLDFIQLISPPTFKIDFTRQTEQLPVPVETPYFEQSRPIYDTMNTYGVRMKQKNTRRYDHPLTVRYYAVGSEVDGENMVLIDRQEEVYIPAKAEHREYSFKGEPKKLRVMGIRDEAPLRGVKYAGNLVTVTDSRGVIIQYKSSPTLLYNLRNRLDLLPIGKHFDPDTGERVPPPRPTDGDRPRQML